jgi:hypothetical protein
VALFYRCDRQHLTGPDLIYVGQSTGRRLNWICPVLRRYVQLFAEEVVRGGPAFAVSLVLSSVEPALRAAAELGAWQVISPVNTLGRVEVVGGLHEVQDKVHSPFSP